MKNDIKNYYIFQFLNSLPQLLVPFLAMLFSASKIENFAIQLVWVGLLSVILDWGSSTVGARGLRLIPSEESEKRRAIIVGYERIKANILIIIFIFYAMAVFFNIISIELKHIAIGFGLATAAIYPAWIILGSKIRMRTLSLIFLYRFISILSVIVFLNYDYNILFLGIIYFGLTFLGSLLIRLILNSNQIKITSLFGKVDIGTLRIGAVITAGSIMMFFITGSGSALLINKINPGMVIEFLVAAGCLAVVRFLTGLFFTRLFINSIKIDLITNTTNLLLYLAVMVAIYTISITFLLLSYSNKNIIYIYTILYFGFLFIGPSHQNITVDILGNGFYFRWLCILFYGFFIYISVNIIGMFSGWLNASYLVASATLLAEISIFMFGKLHRRKYGCI